MPLRGFLSKPSASSRVAQEEDDSSGDEIAGPGPSPRDARPTRDDDAGAVGGARGGGASKLPIQIRTMDGKTYKIEAKTDWDVERLKVEFERWHGGNAAMCSLYYKAKKLQDNNTLLSYKIGAGDFIMANFRSVGGTFI